MATLNSQPCLRDKAPQTVISPNNDVIHKKLAAVAARVNNMTMSAIVAELANLGHSTEGQPAVLSQRLCYHLRQEVLQLAIASGEYLPPPGVLHTRDIFDYLLVVDVEATCEEYTNGFRDNYRHEIIEFPALLYHISSDTLVDTFHSFCRPQVNPVLSTFCTELTNISQATVEAAAPFVDMLMQFETWLNSHELHLHPFAVVCDCNADMSRFIRGQCQISGLSQPRWARHWVNLSRAFKKFYKIKRDKVNLQAMLEHLGMQFQGRPHCGLDDAQNILRVVRMLVRDGCELRVNQRLNMGRPPFFFENIAQHKAEAERHLLVEGKPFDSLANKHSKNKQKSANQSNTSASKKASPLSPSSSAINRSPALLEETCESLEDLKIFANIRAKRTPRKE